MTSPGRVSQAGSVDCFCGAELLVNLHERLGSEGVGPAEFGEDNGGGECHDDGSDSAEDHGRDSPQPIGSNATLKFPELVGGSNKEPVDGADAASHLRWRGKLQHTGADDDRDHVARASNDERYQAEPEVAGESEDDGCRSKDGHADEHGYSCPPFDGASDEQQGDSESADAGHGSQKSEAARPGVQDVFGEDGKQCDRTAEHDGEEVQGNGAEQQLGSPDVLQTGEHGACAERAGLSFYGIGAHHSDEDEITQEHGQGEEIDDGGSTEREQSAGERKGKEKAAGRGARHVCDLVDRGSPGDGVDEVILRHEAGEQCAGSGTAEGPAHTDSDQHSVDGPDAVASEGPRMEGEPEKYAGADCLQAIAQQDDPAAIVAVGSVSGGEHEDKAGEEEREASQSEVECGVRDLVDLPGDGERLRLSANNRQESCALVETEITRTKGIPRPRGRSTVTISHGSMLSYFKCRNIPVDLGVAEWLHFGRSVHVKILPQRQSGSSFHAS